MHKKTKALLRDFKRAIEATPSKPTSVIAKELGVTPQRLYQMKHLHMKDMKRTIKKKEYGITKVHGEKDLGFKPTIIRGEPDDFVQFRELRAEHETLTKDYVELHDQHLALKKQFDLIQKEAYRFQVETFDLKAIVKYLEGKAGQE